MLHGQERMRLEVVCHCWHYSRLLMYQLSSLLLHPPRDVSVTMTVFFNSEDHETHEVLRFFEAATADHVHWHWVELEKPLLFRRAIGRNMAALATQADWIFFCDCDQVFGEGCLDAFTQLQTMEDAVLVYPEYVNCSSFIQPDHPIIQRADGGPAIIDIDPADFSPRLHTRAIGGLQIAKGDIVRRIGYCKDLPRFMKPARRFHRTKEDMAFRRIIGSQGTPVDIPNLYRIEHKQKGRRWLNWWNKL